MTGKQKLILAFLILVFGAHIFMSASNHPARGGDFRGFLIAGERILHGDFLYQDSRVATNVTWPPFFAIFIIPFSLLARIHVQFAQLIWYLFNAALFFLTVRLWCRIIGKWPFAWFDEKQPGSLYSMSVFLPIVFVVISIFRVFEPLQMNIILLYFMSLAVYQYQNKNDVKAGAWLGLAAAIKVFPGLMAPYFIYRKKWKLLFTFGLTGLALTLLPMIRYGFTGYIANLQAWSHIALQGGYPVGGINQSFYAMAARWIASDAWALVTVKLPAPDPYALGTVLSGWLHRGFYLAALFALAVAAHRKKVNSPALEGAFLIAAAMLFSPIAWRNYFILTYPAYFVLYNIWQEKKDRFLLWGILVSVFLVSFLQIVGQFHKHLRGFFNCVISSLTTGTILLLILIVYVIMKGMVPVRLSSDQPE